MDIRLVVDVVCTCRLVCTLPKSLYWESNFVDDRKVRLSVQKGMERINRINQISDLDSSSEIRNEAATMRSQGK